MSKLRIKSYCEKCLRQINTQSLTAYKNKLMCYKCFVEQSNEDLCVKHKKPRQNRLKPKIKLIQKPKEIK